MEDYEALEETTETLSDAEGMAAVDERRCEVVHGEAATLDDLRRDPQLRPRAWKWKLCRAALAWRARKEIVDFAWPLSDAVVGRLDCLSVNPRQVTCSGDGYADFGPFKSVRTESSTKSTTIGVWHSCSLSVASQLRARLIRAERQSPNKALVRSWVPGRFELECPRPGHRSLLHFFWVRLPQRDVMRPRGSSHRRS